MSEMAGSQAPAKVLWIPHTAWAVPQRAHLYASRLAQLGHEVHVTDWDAQFRTIRDFASRRYVRNFTSWSYRSDGVQIHHVPRITPALFSRHLRQLNSAIYERHVSKTIREERIGTVVGSFMVPPPKADRIIFDVFDDNVAYWRTYGIGTDYSREIEEREQSYIERADAIIVASEVLLDKIQAACARRVPVHLIPNGVNLELFREATGESVRERLNLTSPVIGVVGNHDRPDELRLIIDAIRGIDPSLHLLIVGSGSSLSSSLEYAASTGLKRVHAVGRVPHERVPQYLAAMDIGLCPYKATPGAHACSPMRLPEYLASRTRVVCTDLDSVRRWNLSNVELVEDSVAGFAEGIRKSLAKPWVPMDGELARFDLRRQAEQLSAIVNG